MRSNPYNVLFICTGNSARSIMAEGLLNGLGAPNFRAWSAGSHPTGTVNPLAVATLLRMGLPDAEYRSKNWDEFSELGAPQFDFIFTVCDNAAGEVCPFWAGQPITAHWGIPDPAAASGDEEQRSEAFVTAAMALKRRIELFLALPLTSLDGIALTHELREIGKQ